MALHAGLLVAVDRAVELVLAWLQRHGHPRGAAVADGRAVLVDAVALDRDRMRQGGGVLHDDRHPAGLRAQIGLVELQRPARVGGEAQGLAAPRGGRGGGGGRGRRGRRGVATAWGRGFVVVARAAAGREQRGCAKDGNQPVHDPNDAGPGETFPGGKNLARGAANGTCQRLPSPSRLPRPAHPPTANPPTARSSRTAAAIRPTRPSGSCASPSPSLRSSSASTSSSTSWSTGSSTSLPGSTTSFRARRAPGCTSS